MNLTLERSELFDVMLSMMSVFFLQLMYDSSTLHLAGDAGQSDQSRMKKPRSFDSFDPC